MDTVATLLSRLQFAFTISFHIIFPSLSIGLAAWLSVLEALRLATGRQVYRTLFEFWRKISAWCSVLALSPGSSWRFSSEPIGANSRGYRAFMLRAARRSLAIARRSRHMTGRSRLLHAHAGDEMDHPNRVG